MRLRVVTFSALLGVLSGGAAFAAAVDSIQGDVSINRGGGFVKLAKPSTAEVGDSLMASPGGSAQIVYTPECVVKVEPGSVVFVAHEAPCKIQVEGSHEPTGGSLKDEPVVEQPAYTPYLIGGAVVAGGIGACIALCGGGDDPASP